MSLFLDQSEFDKFLTTDASVAKERGNAAYADGNFADALQHYNVAIMIEPKSHVFHRL